MTDTIAGAAGAALTGDNSDAPTPTPTPSGTPTPAPANDTWYSSAPAEYKGLVEKKGWKDAADALKSYSELEKSFHASDKLMFPKDANDKAALDPIYNRLGRPETPDKYQFPEGVDKDAVAAIAPKLHEAGITQTQAALIAGIDLQRQQAAQQAFNERAKLDGDKAYKILSDEWGPKTAENVELNRRAMRALGITPEEAQTYMAYGGAEKFMRLLNIAGSNPKFREDPTGGLGNDTTGTFGMTSNRAAMELAQKGKDLRERAMKGDKGAKAELNRLYKASAGEA